MSGRLGEADGQRHLTWADLEALAGGPAPEGPARAVAEHLGGCALCKEQMEQYRRQTRQLAALRQTDEQLGPDCPAPERLVSLAAGTLQAEESEELLDHAAGCGSCGALLRMASEDFTAETVPPEAAPALSPEFRQKIARLVSEPAPVKRPAPPRWIWAAAAAVAAVAAGVALRPLLTGPSAEQLVARAFEARRTLNARIPDARHVPLAPNTRSAADAALPTAEAAAAILRGLSRNPEDPRLLRMRARLEVVRGLHEQAVQTLEPLAGRGGPDTPIDLGIAYLARGTAENAPGDFEKAVEALSRALRERPGDPIALFNRALAYESLFLWDSAESDWKAFLASDSSSGWAIEAREHLTALEKKKSSGSRD